MNRNALIAAIPFAAFFDIAVLVMVLTGYRDNTLITLVVASLVITVVLALKAVGKLPSWSWGRTEPEVREVHHHHYHEDEDEQDECEGCEDCYTEEDLQEARDEADSDGYDRGFQDGKCEGYDEGYAQRESEEKDEAEALAKAVVAEMNKPKVEVPLTSVDTPAGNP